MNPNYSEPVARDFPDCISIIEEKVKPERALVKRDANRIWWWQYAEHRPGLRKAIQDLDRVLVVPLVSKYVNAVWLPNNGVFTHKLAVFADSSEKMFALIQSTHHALWVRKYSSTLKTDINYSPSDCFENFPLPDGDIDSLLVIKYEGHRKHVCSSRNIGITQVYNLLHDPRCDDVDIIQLRNLQIDLDNEVSRLYGIETNKEYKFYDGDHVLENTADAVGRTVRYTVSPEIRRQILQKLRELNNKMYASELSSGLHQSSATQKRNSKEKAKGTKSTSKLQLKTQEEQPKLF